MCKYIYTDNWPCLSKSGHHCQIMFVGIQTTTYYLKGGNGTYLLMNKVYTKTSILLQTSFHDLQIMVLISTQTLSRLYMHLENHSRYHHKDDSYFCCDKSHTEATH